MNNKAKDKETKKKNDLLIRTIVFLFVSLAFCSVFIFKTQVENLVNFNLNKNALSTEIDDNGLKVHFIDVDQGDCTLVETPSGEKILIDTGDTNEKSQNKVKSYLDGINFKYENGERVIDYLILTHPDSDHLGGASYVFSEFLIKNCYLPAVYYYDSSDSEAPPLEIPEGAPTTSSEVYKATLIDLNTEIDNFNCQRVFSCENLEISSSISSWKLEFFAPIYGKQYFKSGTEAKTNNYSPILILSFKNKKIMLTGDAEKKVETDFVEKVGENGYGDFSSAYFDVDILKAGHHGSNTSSSEEFLKLVCPEYAIISAGANNQFNHPSPEAIERLKENGVDEKCIYQTSKNGNILVGISTEGKLSLVANHVQYTLVEFKCWQIYLICVGGTAIIVYSPYLIKISKLNKKGAKSKK